MARPLSPLARWARDPRLLALAVGLAGCTSTTTTIETTDPGGGGGDADEGGDGDAQGDGDPQGGRDGQGGDGQGGDGQGGDGQGGDGQGGGDGDENVPPGDCLEAQSDSVAAAVTPPGGLQPSQVPQFVMFGFDDNAYADGMNWVVDELFAGRTNKDGSPARATFFIIGGTSTTEQAGIFNDFGGQTEDDVLASWRNAFQAGHEIGNHTWDHAEGGDSRSLADWQVEVDKSNALLKDKLGIPQCQLAGFRFPYLKFDDAAFTAIENANYTYDTSMEFGYDWWQPPGSQQGYGSGSPESTKHFWWPFTLDQAVDSSFNCCSHGVQPHPGIWEFPAHVFSRPDPGDPNHLKAMTGLDYNVWLTAANDTTVDFCETLKYTFKLHYDGNRSPMNAGMHSDIYSEFNETADSGFHNNASERRAALKCFLDYVLTFEDARVVTFKDVVRWLRNPQPL